MTEVTTDGVRLDDGTSGALIPLEGDAADLRPAFQPGDALNAIGIPKQRDETVLVVAGAADLELVADLGDADPTAPDAIELAALTVDSTGAPARSPEGASTAGVPGIDALTIGIAAVVLSAAAAAALGLAARRQRARRLMRTRIAARLEALGRGSNPPAAGPDRPPEAPIVAQSGPELGGTAHGSA